MSTDEFDRDRISSAWWEWAADWRRISATLPNGAIGARLGEYAARQGRTPGRIRRAVAAQVAAEEMAASGLVPDATVLSKLALDDVESLKRLLAYGEDAVREPLRRVLNEVGVSGSILRQIERRARSSGVASAQGGRAVRLGAKGFADRVVEMAAGAAGAAGRPLIRDRYFRAALPVPLDALIAYPEGRLLGVRAMPARPGIDLRARRRDAILLVLGAGRYIDAMLLIYQDDAEAAEMDDRIGELRIPKAKACHIEDEDAFLIVGAAEWQVREGAPDLLHTIRAELESAFKTSSLKG